MTLIIRTYPPDTFFVLAYGLSWIQESPLGTKRLSPKQRKQEETSVRSPKSLVYEAQLEA